MIHSDRQPWRLRAACADVDPIVFFPVRGEDTAEAKAICAGCPVQVDCLDYALHAGIKHGIWGGRSERARRQLRRELRITTLEPDLDTVLFDPPQEGPTDAA